ncbi:hypothetical protein ACHAQH_005165 [Verticillium albo-atrum]
MNRPALEQVYGSLEAKVDIIAVHGLGSDVDWAWTWKDPENTGHYVKWLEDPAMLPAIIPDSRILLYNYDSRWHANAPKVRLSLCGEDLIRTVRDCREGATASRPIIFVGHSLGGNVIQHALLYANSDDVFRHVVTTTAGVIFLGSPLHGSNFQSLAKAITRFSRFVGSHDGIIDDLGINEPGLRDRLHDFCRMRNTLSIPVTCCFELYESAYSKQPLVGGVLKGMMNKYSGPDDRAFQSVSKELRRLSKDIITSSDYLLREKPEAKECLPHLFLTDPFEDMQAMKRKKGGRAKGTCDWILGTDELTTWLGELTTGLGDSPELMPPRTDILWLHGNPGTGKSTTSMFLAEALSEAFSKTTNKTLAYFFCDRGYDTRKTATAIIRGLLLQLVQQHPRLIEHVLPKYEERKARAFDSFDALWGMFLKACADTATGRKYCVVDALDECEKDDQETLLKQIEETFGRGRSGSLNISFLITSRPYSEIKEHLQDFPNKDLASFEESARDIIRFIDEKVAGLKRKKGYTDGIAFNVAKILLENAGGIFLWVGLACQELEKETSKNAVKHLTKIPKGLESLYEQLLDTALQNEDAPTIRKLLGFVMVARRPLTTRELVSACGLFQDDGEKERILFTTEVIASCRLLIVVQDEKVLLLHQSVRDFLISATGRGHLVSEREAHNTFSTRCVACLITKFSIPGAGHKTEADDLVSYSVQFWPEHAHMAAEVFSIEQTQSAFFTIDSKIREAWWTAFHDRYDRFGPSSASIFHVAARWGVAKLLDYALSSRQSHARAPEHVGSWPYVDSVYRDSHGKTPLERCAASSHIPVMESMIERLDPQEGVGGAVTRAAAGNEKSGAEVMKLLLDQKGDQITITEDTLNAAARNGESGAEVMELLLDRKGDQIIITEDTVNAAARNEWSAPMVMKVLLDRDGDRITITEGTVNTAAGNELRGAEVMKLLLDRKGDQITITEDTVNAAAGNEESGAEVMELLLDRKGDQITITEDTVNAAATNEESGAEMMKVLLDRRGDQIIITEDTVNAAARNGESGAEVMKLLLDRKGDQIIITEDTVNVAARNEWSAPMVMKVLLDRDGDRITITEGTVNAAAGNELRGAEVMKLLLDRKGDQIMITADTVVAAARNEECGAEVMELLLDRKGDQIIITEDTINAAAGNELRGAEVMKLLLDRKGDQIMITADIVNAAARNEQSGAKVMELLLDRKGDQITITADTLNAVAWDELSGARVMKLLLDRKGDQIPISQRRLH